MKWCIALAIAVALWPSILKAQADQRKESARVVSRVADRLMRGDLEALDDVKNLPGEDAVAGLLLFFMQNNNLYKATPQQKAIAERSAQYVSELPQSEAYIRRMFLAEEGRKDSPALQRYRQAGLNCLSALANSYSANIAFDLLNDPNLDVPAKDLAFAIAKMSLPGAPYSATDRQAGTPEAVANWKAWWQANKASYPQR